MSDDQRKRTRVNFRATVTLKGGGVEFKDLDSRDLSLKGIFVLSEQKLPIGTLVDVALDLSGGSSLVRLKMKGQIARSEPEGMAVDFTEVDLDSFYHLRNIVLYNSGDPLDVDQELATKPAF